MQVNSELTQQDGWNTQDSRMTKNCCVNWNAQSRTTYFRHSAVLSLPAVLLRTLPNQDLMDGLIDM